MAHGGSSVLRIVFAGTPEFAQLALQHLHAAGHDIVLVLTQPDRPAGRGMKLHQSAVKQFALAQGLPLAQPRSLRLDGKFPEDAAQTRRAIAEANADVMVVAAYGLILPQWVLDDMVTPAQTPLPGAGAATKLGCLNIHGSLLPRWRGAAPIHRAIEAGDRETGITIMQMDAGLDTGDILLMHSTAIAPTDTTATLHDRMATLGAELIVTALDQAIAGALQPHPQPTQGVTYAHKIEKHEAAINWHLDADRITQRVRAFNPFPGACAQLNGETIKVWAARPAHTTPSAENPCRPGEIVAVAPVGIEVCAINSVVTLTELQRPGGKRLSAAEFVRGFDVRAGMCFEAPDTTGGVA